MQGIFEGRFYAGVFVNDAYTKVAALCRERLGQNIDKNESQYVASVQTKEVEQIKARYAKEQIRDEYSGGIDSSVLEVLAQVLWHTDCSCPGSSL